MKNKKLIYLIGILAVIGVAIVSALVIFKMENEKEQQYKSIYGKDIYGGNIDNVESIYITSGNTGNIVKLDKEDIREVLNMLDLIEFVPEKAEERTGWTYSLSITASGKSTDITFAGYICTIDDKKYMVNGADSEEIYNKLDEIYKNSSAGGN